ncbi:hypothetical protein K435DRAFT_193931 [Dendrothele bispora CBS 962.96]|uniref:Uncharacterized protein n=1 Tax=Dendrothele bispora (strain CBS 962.96) TaxID=1314807 RepID=A0A4S8LUY8_DENBC|nr:hypothetical protein K435DRAFT_193931 [Dendrothele bispora CBS 962.96]
MGCFNIYCFLSIAFLLLTFISTTVRGVKLAHSSPTTTTTSSSSSFHNSLQFEFPHDHRSSDIMVGDSVQIHWKRNSTTDPMDSGIFFAALHPSSQTQTPDQLQSQPSWQIPLRLEKIFGLRNHDSSPSASVVADPIIDLSELELDTHTERRYHGKELEEGDRVESKMRRPALVVEDRMATIRKVVTVEVGQNEGIITLPTFYHGYVSTFCGYPKWCPYPSFLF